MSDYDRVKAECRLARRGRREISDACARVIGGMYHEGQGSVSYSFASTGAIPENADVLWSELFPDWDALDRSSRVVAAMTLTYLLAHAGRAPVEGWSKLWLEG